MLSILLSFILLIISLVVVVKSAEYAILFSTKLAESFRLSKYIVGFLIVAVISILPEAFIAVTSAINDVPGFGLGTLFGSNVADLSLVFALLIFLTGHQIKVESKIIKNSFRYLFMIALPILFGLNGHYSRLEGITLLAAGLLFFWFTFKSGKLEVEVEREKFNFLNLVFLAASMSGLLIGAHYTVEFGVNLANGLGIRPSLIGILVVGLGTTLPEMFFSLKAIKSRHDSLALGDLLGTVIADATIVVGLIAVIRPFAFNIRIVYISGVFMIAAMILLLRFMKTGKILTKKEAFALLVFYHLFILSEILVNI